MDRDVLPLGLSGRPGIDDLPPGQRNIPDRSDLEAHLLCCRVPIARNHPHTLFRTTSSCHASSFGKYNRIKAHVNSILQHKLMQSVPGLGRIHPRGKHAVKVTIQIGFRVGGEGGAIRAFHIFSDYMAKESEGYLSGHVDAGFTV